MKATTVHGHFNCRSPNPNISAPEQARSRIIAATAKGTIEWDATGKDADAPIGRRADLARDQKVLELFDSGEYTRKEIAEQLGSKSSTTVDNILQRHGQKRAQRG